MATKTVKVGSKVGLHSRPATTIAQAVTKSGENVQFWTDDPDEAVDAGSALMIMTLGAEMGDEVTIECDNEAVLAEIATMVESDLDA